MGRKDFDRGYFTRLAVVLCSFYLYGVFALVLFPISEAHLPYILTDNVFMSINSVVTFLLVFYLFYKFLRRSLIEGGRKGISLKFLAAGFGFYGVTITGLLLTVFGFFDETVLLNFFVNRIFMVFSISSIAYSSFCFKGCSFLRKLVPLVALVGGFLWFLFGIFYVGSIGYTMFGFLSFVWSPLMVFSGYVFFRRSEIMVGWPGYLFSFGMIMLGMSYLLWPLSFNWFFYTLVWTMVNISLLFLVTGIHSMESLSDS